MFSLDFKLFRIYIEKSKGDKMVLWGAQVIQYSTVWLNISQNNSLRAVTEKAPDPVDYSTINQ